MTQESFVWRTERLEFAPHGGPVIAVLDASSGHLVVTTMPGVDLVRVVSGLDRTEAPRIERHASQHLKDDCAGVGHTYLPDSVHYWLPWTGTGNMPHPPEHPVTGAGNLGDPPYEQEG